jgi:beta-glucanase (GH16 family)
VRLLGRNPGFFLMKHLPALTAACLAFPAALHAQGFGVPAKPVFEGKAENIQLKPSSAQVTAQAGGDGITVRVMPGEEGYPGLSLVKKDGTPFDLSKHGHVEAKIANTGTKNLALGLRLDNPDDWKNNPYNTENLHLKPGETGVVNLIFGHSYGKKKSYPLKPENISQILFFTTKSEGEQSFRIESMIAAGTPGELPAVDPATIRVKPQGEVVYDASSKINAEKQIDTWNKARASVVSDGIRAVYPGGKDTGSLVFRPEQGRWDLSQSLQVVVKIKNDGATAVSPNIRLESNGGPSDTIDAGTLAPGESKEVVIPFPAKEIWIGAKDAGQKGDKGTGGKPGTKIASDAISAVIVAVPNIDSERSLVLQSVKANLPPTPKMPEWLGKKPPVEGEWSMTFEDNFDGTSPDAAKWNIYAENYWDKSSAFSKDNLLVEGGFAKLRYERKSNHHNDDPKAKKFDYTTGFLDTYGKWTQRYGYFETRAKLPTSPGLWPAFWLMPDRGAAAGEKWQRQDTGNGGMEFDIIEHLTRWGPYRYNVAMHWDGYGKEHKAIGSSNIYVQPDKDGFVTVGLLWLPGSATYYFNGVKMAHWETDRMSAIQSHLMYTLPQGGWDNNAVDDKKLPDDFVIDYVRVWQKKDLATEGDGPKSPAPAK